MNKEKNTLVEEGSGRYMIDGGLISLEPLASGAEFVEGIVRGETDCPNNGDMWLELGTAELGYEAVHEVLDSGRHIFRRKSPHRIHVLFPFRGLDRGGFWVRH